MIMRMFLVRNHVSAKNSQRRLYSSVTREQHRPQTSSGVGWFGGLILYLFSLLLLIIAMINWLINTFFPWIEKRFPLLIEDVLSGVKSQLSR